jgi:pimeloyl-ACP methyl ester carboxylesterase
MPSQVEPAARNPIVILGGFLSFSMLYAEMRESLAQITGQPVWIVETRSLDWAPCIVPPGWTFLLRKLDDAVRQAVRQSATGKVTLVGHSAGGVLARTYLSPKPFLRHAYRGLDHINHLITLGSPHDNQRKSLHGGRMSRWAEKRYPGAFFAPRVKYTSVAGKLLRGNREGSLRERHAHVFYEEIIGSGDAWGDGLVPVASALLHGSRQIVLEGVGHFTGFGGPWYGAAEVIPQWWSGDAGNAESEDEFATNSDI